MSLSDNLKLVCVILSIMGFTESMMPFFFAVTNTPSDPEIDRPNSLATFLPFDSSIIRRDPLSSTAKEIEVASPGSKNPCNPI